MRAAKQNTKRIPAIIRNISSLLIMIMFFKIAGYFTIVDDRTITQILKVILRIGMTICILYTYHRIVSYGCVASFVYKNSFNIMLYAVYLFLGMASFLWSTKPSYSSLQWLMTFESFVFVFFFIKVIILVNYYFPDYKVDMIKIFSWAIFFIQVILLIGSLIAPDVFYREMRGGEEIRFGGYLMNPNELGMLASIGAALGYLLFQTSKKKFWPLIILLTGVLTLALTTSRSSMIGFLLIMFVLIVKSDNKKLKMIMVVGIGLAVPFILQYVIFKEGGGVEEVMSMTGRIPFWTALLNEGIVREPFLGFGFMRINYIDTFQGVHTYPGRMTHNTFMQVLMNLGFIGFFIAFWNLVLTIKNFFIEKGHFYGDFFIAMLIPVFINSLTEFGIFGDANYAILFYQFMMFLFVIKYHPQLSLTEKVKLKLLYKKYDAYERSENQN